MIQYWFKYAKLINLSESYDMKLRLFHLFRVFRLDFDSFRLRSTPYYDSDFYSNLNQLALISAPIPSKSLF